MRNSSRPLFDLRRLALTVALLGAGLAQAAGLAITSGSVAGQLSAQAGANGLLKDSSATLADTSGTGSLLGLAALQETTALGAGPVTQLSRAWNGAALLNARNISKALFQIGTASMLDLSGDGGFDGGLDSSGLVLDAELRIVATAGEADGTPVRLVISGEAQALVNSFGPALDAIPTFSLELRDAESNILASWQSLAVGTGASFSIGLDSRVGDSLTFSLSHGNTTLLAGAASLGAGGRLEATAQLTGMVQVTAVPEPETYALFIAGLGALGLLHKRQRQRQGQGNR